MRAIGFKAPHPIDHPEAFMDLDLPDPVPAGRDLLVRVEAISVNPVDFKQRRSATPPEGEARILGFDAAGVVVGKGPEASLYEIGDAVYYAGSLSRPGSNAELQLVDERIVGHKPESLDFAAAAALPLTAITAWEMLFDRLDVKRPVPGAAPAIVIVGGAGGVGSIAVQLARQLTGLTVIATASRPETAAWVRDLGAHHVIDHAKPMAPQIAALGLGQPGFAFATNQPDRHLYDLVELLAPQGRIGFIDGVGIPDGGPLLMKAIAVHWELMFTRPMFGTADMIAQKQLLDEIGRLVDTGTLRSTATETLGRISVENLIRAHAQLETGTTRGKLVLSGW